MRRLVSLSILSAAFVAAVAPSPIAASQTMTSARTGDRPVPFAVGETLTYDVTWSGVSAGTAILAVKERRVLSGGDTAYYIVGEAKPGWLLEKLHHFYYKADALLNTRTLLPFEASLYSDEEGKTRNKITKFVDATTVDVELKTTTVERARYRVAPASLDPISVVYVLRTLPLGGPSRQTIVIPVADGDSTFKFSVPPAVHDTLRTPLGLLPCWRVQPTLTDDSGAPATAHDLTLWISDDARHLPLRFDAAVTIGSVRLTLATASK